MKIDFSKTVEVSGAPVFLEKDIPATLGVLCREAVNTAPENRRLPLEDMIERGRLAQRLKAEGEQEVSPEEAALIRKCLPDRFQHPELVVVLYDALS